MTSPKRSDANRRNARRSTGPKSAGGRKRASLNALKHGLTAQTVLLPFEDRTAYNRASSLITAQFRPEGAIEACLVELIIADRWRLVRLARIEDEYVVATFDQRDVDVPRLPLRTRRDSAQDQLRRIFGERFEQPMPDVGEPPARVFVPDCRPATNGGRQATLRRIADCLADENTLLNAYVSRASPAPMNEIVRQRRQVTREMLRNLAALETLQQQRKSILACYKAGNTNTAEDIAPARDRIRPP